MKWMKWVGMAAALVLIASCYMKWTWHPDIEEYFTGLYSKDGMLGRPGIFIRFVAVIYILFQLIPKVWAKLINILFSAILVAYCIRSFLIYTACAGGICPEKQPGIWVMVVSAVVVLIASFFPGNLKTKN